MKSEFERHFSCGPLYTGACEFKKPVSSFAMSMTFILIFVVELIFLPRTPAQTLYHLVLWQSRGSCSLCFLWMPVATVNCSLPSSP